jgi:hypothetical protein
MRNLCLVDQLDLLLFGAEDTEQALAIRDIKTIFLKI